MPKTILVIEDEGSIRNIIKAFLEDAGYTVILAADGLEGMEQFRKYRPDLVLLDLMLPKTDGFARVWKFCGKRATFRLSC